MTSIDAGFRVFLPVIHTFVSKVLFTDLPPDIHRAYT